MRNLKAYAQHILENEDKDLFIGLTLLSVLYRKTPSGIEINSVHGKDSDALSARNRELWREFHDEIEEDMIRSNVKEGGDGDLEKMKKEKYVRHLALKTVTLEFTNEKLKDNKWRIAPIWNFIHDPEKEPYIDQLMTKIIESDDVPEESKQELRRRRRSRGAFGRF